MNRRTQAIIGATVVALGLGVYALGFVEAESNVRYVEDLHADPGAHLDGPFTLLGIPLTAPEAPTATTYTTRSIDGSATVLTTHTLRYDGPPAQDDPFAGVAPDAWTLEVTVIRTDGGGSEMSTTFPLHGRTIFQVHAFGDDPDRPAVWAVFDGVLRDDIQPKPSQFIGRLTPGLPAGALIYQVEPDGFIVGCSSKFLPDDVAETYDSDGDGWTD